MTDEIQQSERESPDEEPVINTGGLKSPGTLRDWLSHRTPTPPPQLSDRLLEIVGDETFNSPNASLALLQKGIQTLRSALSDPDGALDLLAADALITYAMEAAADDCATMDAAAAEAIQRIAHGTE